MIDVSTEAIPFEVFASFKRIEAGNPIISLPPPYWAAATHAIIIDDTVHYIWCKRDIDVRWLMMHATAPISDLTNITQDPRNPILEPSVEGFDNAAVEYPFPFLNPADNMYYMYYRGKGQTTPEQTGLLVSDGDMGKWERVSSTPVIPADTEHERHGSTHPSVAIEGDTIHIVYTGKATQSFGKGLTMCHATAPTRNPGKDFSTFEPNPYNPVFSPSENPKSFDCDGVLTGQVLEIGDTYVMLYAGKKGKEWQTGLATI